MSYFMTGNTVQHFVRCDRVLYDGLYLSVCLFTVWQDAKYQERGPKYCRREILWGKWKSGCYSLFVFEYKYTFNI